MLSFHSFVDIGKCHIKICGLDCFEDMDGTQKTRKISTSVMSFFVQNVFLHFWGAFFLSNNLLRSLGKRWAPAIQMLCLSWATWLDGWEGPMEYIRGPPLNATFPHKKYGLIKGVIKGSWWWRITFDNALCLLGGGGVGAPLGSHDTWMMNEVWDQFLKNWDVFKS